MSGKYDSKKPSGSLTGEKRLQGPITPNPALPHDSLNIGISGVYLKGKDSLRQGRLDFYGMEKSLKRVLGLPFNDLMRFLKGENPYGVVDFLHEKSKRAETSGFDQERIETTQIGNEIYHELEQSGFPDYSHDETPRKASLRANEESKPLYATPRHSRYPSSPVVKITAQENLTLVSIYDPFVPHSSAKVLRNLDRMDKERGIHTLALGVDTGYQSAIDAVSRSSEKNLERVSGETVSGKLVSGELVLGKMGSGEKMDYKSFPGISLFVNFAQERDIGVIAADVTAQAYHQQVAELNIQMDSVLREGNLRNIFLALKEWAQARSKLEQEKDEHTADFAHQLAKETRGNLVLVGSYSSSRRIESRIKTIMANA